jgi:hypothetical protein
MILRFSASLVAVVCFAACASAPQPRLPAEPAVVDDSYPGLGAAQVKHEALESDLHEGNQALTVRIASVDPSPLETPVELVLRPGESEVIRLKPGRYEYVVTSSAKKKLRDSFEIAPPLRLFFDLTLSLRQPVKQAYLSNAEGMKRQQTLHHPMATLTILSDSPQQLTISERGPRGARFRSPLPLPPCPPPEEVGTDAQERVEEVVEVGVNLMGSLLGRASNASAPPPQNPGDRTIDCYDEQLDPAWAEWMDRYVLEDVMRGVIPETPLAVESTFSVSLGVPANVNVPAGHWLLSGNGKEVEVEIDAATRIVIIEWDLSPPEVHMIPEAR